MRALVGRGRLAWLLRGAEARMGQAAANPWPKGTRESELWHLVTWQLEVCREYNSLRAGKHRGTPALEDAAYEWVKAQTRSMMQAEGFTEAEKIWVMQAAQILCGAPPRATVTIPPLPRRDWRLVVAPPRPAAPTPSVFVPRPAPPPPARPPAPAAPAIVARDAAARPGPTALPTSAYGLPSWAFQAALTPQALPGVPGAPSVALPFTSLGAPRGVR